MSTENIDAKNSIRTFTGIYIDILDPQIDQISILDISTGLSNTCRWAGQIPQFYSVAEHSVRVAQKVREVNIEDHNTILASLLHDASEAYLGDIASPIKAILPDYKSIEKRLQSVIYEHFGLIDFDRDLIKRIDREVLEWEWNNLKINQKIRPFTPVDAKALYYEWFNMFSVINNLN